METQLRIGGMTCINCQNKIERKLYEMAGVLKTEVSYNTGTAKITYDADQISIDEITAVIENLDYEVIKEQEGQQPDISRIICLLIVIISLYLLLQHFGVLNLLAPSRLADTGMGYGMLFVVGLITSVHCIAMCGGINLTQCIPKKDVPDNGHKLSAFRPAFLYNLGRVLSYTVIGFILGLAGMLIGGGSDAGLPTLFQGILKLIAGVFMVIMGINMLDIFPWLRKLNPRMPKFLAQKIGRQKGKSRQPFVVGLLNGLMPCGPLQSMQIVALASQNPLIGALSMLVFSLGTVPLMLGLGSVISVLGKKFRQKVTLIGAVLVVVLGLAMLSQGSSLSGLVTSEQLLGGMIVLGILGVIGSIPFKKTLHKGITLAAAAFLMITSGLFLRQTLGENNQTSSASEVEIVDGVQVVNSTLSSGSYPSITVLEGIPVKWIINAPAGSINGCNYKIIMKEYGIEYAFQEGENMIEFTPTETGTYDYTCWMGMIRGRIYVTDGTEDPAAVSDSDANTGASGSCCFR